MIEVSFKRDEVIKTLLENASVNVYFIKLNGDYREMNATLNPEALKSFGEERATSDEAEYDDNQIRLFDIDIKEWRSFLLTNLISIEVN